MKKVICTVLCIIMVAGCFMGCSKKTSETTGKPADSATGTTADKGEEVTPSTVTVWHDGDEAIMQTIADVVNPMLEDKKITVKFEKKTGLTDQLKLYGNDEANGPDMYMYAHDSLGIFAEMGILAPITDVISADDLSDMIDMTVKAGQYKDTQYLMPVYFETLLFMYNKALWEGDVPDTTEDLYKYMEAHTDTAAGTYAVVNQHSSAYNVAPFINGFGGYIIDADAKAGLDDAKTIEAIEYNKKFAALQADGDYNTVTTLFNEGKAAAIIGGPWLVSGIKDAGIDLGIKSLSDFKLPDGNSLAPYSGVQGMGVMKFAAENKKDAIAEVLKAVASPEVGIALANKSNCAPANTKAYADDEVMNNEMIIAIKKTADTAQPMPNIPQMSVMWEPTEKMLAEVNKSGADVKTAAKEYQKAALQAIEDMQ